MISEKVSLKQNAFAFYSKEQLFAHAAVDPAWLNATLSLIALHHDLNTGKGISHECLFHRGEALRIVNERLKESRHVNDATIGAIASLANFDVSCNEFLHIMGMVAYTHKTDHKWTIHECNNAYQRSRINLGRPRSSETRAFTPER